MRALVGFTVLAASALALTACNGSGGEVAANNSETVDTTIVPDDESVAAENASGNEATANASDDKGSDDRGSDDRGSDDRGSDDRGSDDRGSDDR
jgi:hypothetical protein